jgi:hypothetical protein
MEGPFRVNATAIEGDARALAPGAPAPLRAARQAPGDEYLQRLIKLIPSEILALYVTFKEIAASWLGIWATICLALVLFARIMGTYRKDKGVQWVAVVVASVSFVLWVYATGGNFLGLEPPAIPGLISIAVGVWTFIVPFFYKGD